MQLEQGFQLPTAPERAWPAFKDIALLVDCLPGASLTGPAVDGNHPMKFDVKLGPISASFVGSGQVSFDDANQTGRFEGTATDKRTNSRVKGLATFSLSALETGTQVQVVVDYSLTGSLAQFSRGGIVRELAAALTAQFAAALAERVREPAPAPADTPAQTTLAMPPAQPAAAASLDAGSLLRAVFKARLLATWQWLRSLWQRPA